MRAGRVVRIRVNPKDCLSCVDIVNKAEIYTRGMSFAQLVSIALSSMLEAYRQGGHIPVRDGFEWIEMMAPFGDSPQVDRARKLAITEVIQSAGSDTVVPPAVDVHAIQRQRWDIRWNELSMRKQMEPDNFTPEDQAELDRLSAQLGLNPG